MARMTAADVAVAIMLREGVTHAFGVPGAAINPLYAALLRSGGIDHVLARHVEGASHMAEGYTRATAGNIGLCVGTSGPAGTDMIAGLYSAWADFTSRSRRDSAARQSRSRCLTSFRPPSKRPPS